MFLSPKSQLEAEKYLQKLDPLPVRAYLWKFRQISSRILQQKRSAGGTLESGYVFSREIGKCISKREARRHRREKS